MLQFGDLKTDTNSKIYKILLGEPLKTRSLLTIALGLSLAMSPVVPMAVDKSTNSAYAATSPSVVLEKDTFTFTEGEATPFQYINYSFISEVPPSKTSLFPRNDIGIYGSWTSVEGNAAAPFGITFGMGTDANGNKYRSIQGTPQIGTAGKYIQHFMLTVTIDGVQTEHEVDLNVIVLPSPNPPTPVKKIEAYANLNSGYDFSFGFTGMKVNAPYGLYLDGDMLTGADGYVQYSGVVPFNGELGLSYNLPQGLLNGWHKIEFKSTYYDGTKLHYSASFMSSNGVVSRFEGNPASSSKKFANCSALRAKYPYGVIKNTTVQKKVIAKKAKGWKGYRNTALYNKNVHLDYNRNGLVCEK